MNPTLVSYFVYAALSMSLVAWVGRALKRNGAHFLGHVFTTEGLADSVNQLLLVGFYLVNIGFAARQLRSASGAADATQAVELLADKIGVVALVLGAMHFFNLFVFSRMWKARTHTGAPASGPQCTLPRQERRGSLPEIPGAPTSATIPG